MQHKHAQSQNSSHPAPLQGQAINVWALQQYSSASVSSHGLHDLGRTGQRLSLQKGFQVVDTCQSYVLQPPGMLCGVMPYQPGRSATTCKPF